MANTGWVLAGTGGIAARTGGTSDWTNPGNVTADDGSNAAGTGPTNYLVATNFDFSAVPAGSVVTGIQVKVDIASNTGTLLAYLTKDAGTNVSSMGTSSADTGAVELPPETNSPWFIPSASLAEIQTSTFGVAMYIINTGINVSVDAVWMKLYYGAPVYRDVQTGATDAGGAWSYTCQTGAAGDVFIVQILQDGATTGALTSVVGSNIENLAGTDNVWTIVPEPGPSNDWIIGASNEARCRIYIGRATGTSAPTISGANSTSEDLYIRSYRFQNVSTGTTLADVIENATAGVAARSTGTSNTASDAGVTTLGPDRLALNFVAVNDDNAIALFTGMSGGTWVEVAEYAESSGTDGAIQMQYALIDSAATINGATASITDIDAWIAIGFALIGTTVDVTPDGVPRRLKVYPQLLAH